MTATGPGTRPWLLLEEPKTMGARIRFLRIAQGMTQTDLARKAAERARWDELSKSFISLMEAGRTQPSVRTLAGVAEALGASMDWLWTGRPARRSRPSISVKLRTGKVPPSRSAPVFVAVTVDGRRAERSVSRKAVERLLPRRNSGDGGETSTPQSGKTVPARRG